MNEDNKITRRDALKRMGAAVISGAVASSGLLSLASCEGKKRTNALSFLFHRNGQQPPYRPPTGRRAYGTAEHSTDGEMWKV